MRTRSLVSPRLAKTANELESETPPVIYASRSYGSARTVTVCVVDP